MKTGCNKREVDREYARLKKKYNIDELLYLSEKLILNGFQVVNEAWDKEMDDMARYYGKQ